MTRGMLRAATLAALCWPLPAAGASARAEVLAPVHRLFAAIARRDGAAMAAETAPGLQVTIEHDGKLRRLTIADLADRLAAIKGGRIAEPLAHPLVRIDRNLAVVWVRFRFLVDGRVSDCGTDLIDLAKVSGQWKIVNLTYNAVEACR